MKLLLLEQSPKGIVKGLGDLEIRGQVEFKQTTALRTARRLEETWYHSNSNERPSSNAGTITKDFVKRLRR